MDYFILTDNSFFRLINGESDISPAAAYQEFVVHVITLCDQADNGYKAVALTYAETELQFVEGISGEISRYVKKALAFVQKMLKLVADGQIQAKPTAQVPNVAGAFKWTGKKSDYVELIYGLQTMGVINGGKTNVRGLLEAFNSIFGDVVPFEQCYTLYEAIKRRKVTSKAAFLESMMNGVHNRIKEDDRKEQARR